MVCEYAFFFSIKSFVFIAFHFIYEQKKAHRSQTLASIEHWLKLIKTDF